MMGRFATVKGNESPRDRTLIAFVGQGGYEFGTYDSRSGEKLTRKIEYGGQLEGIWNYVFFGYRRGAEVGEATATVLFADGAT